MAFQEWVESYHYTGMPVREQKWVSMSGKDHGDERTCVDGSIKCTQRGVSRGGRSKISEDATETGRCGTGQGRTNTDRFATPSIIA